MQAIKPLISGVIDPSVATWVIRNLREGGAMSPRKEPREMAALWSRTSSRMRSVPEIKGCDIRHLWVRLFWSKAKTA
jgi:hypothetical protein